jgi:hypothetical protein
MLRFLLRVQEQDIARTRRWIDEPEREAAAERHGEEQDAARRWPDGDWILSPRASPGARIWLPVGYCWDLRSGMITVARDQAVEALTHGGVQACRPVGGDQQVAVVAPGEALAPVTPVVIPSRPVDQPGPVAGFVAGQRCDRYPSARAAADSHHRSPTALGPGLRLRRRHGEAGFVLEDQPGSTGRR